MNNILKDVEKQETIISVGCGWREGSNLFHIHKFRNKKEVWECQSLVRSANPINMKKGFGDYKAEKARFYKDRGK